MKAPTWNTETQRIMLEEATHRITSIHNTVQWWVAAHNDRTPYHERFSGYCPHCNVNPAKSDMPWVVTTPRLVATS